MKALARRKEGIRTREVERRLNIWLLPLLVVALGVVYILTGFRGWLVFFLGLAGMWLIAVIWILTVERNLSLERKVHLAWATVGESVPEQVKLVNRGWLPAVWVEITDVSVSLESPLRLVSDVPQHSYRNRNLNHLFKRRGLYTLGPTRLRYSDPFGIYTTSRLDKHTSTVLITPPVLSLTHLKVPSGGWAGDAQQRRGFIARNISAAGLRNYVPGDSLKRIHWRATAHHDQLIVRQLEAATSQDWWIFVDLDRTEQAGMGEQSTVELSIVLAASLALRGLREYRKVGLVLAGPNYVSLEPSADPTHRWRLLRALAVSQAGSHSLADLLIHSHYSQGATAILVTASTNPAWVATTDRLRKGSTTLAILVDPTDFGRPCDQRPVLSALAQSRIPHVRMPGSLLEEAYASSGESKRRQITSGEQGKRYIQSGRQSWQSMD